MHWCENDVMQVEDYNLNLLQTFGSLDQTFFFFLFFLLAILLTKIYNTLHYLHYSHYIQHSTILRFLSLSHTERGENEKKKKKNGQTLHSFAASCAPDHQVRIF